jgi:hypothetical protein
MKSSLVDDSDMPWSDHHILIFDEDWHYLAARFGPGSSNPIGVGPAIRLIVHGTIRQMRQEEAKVLDQPQPARGDRQ